MSTATFGSTRLPREQHRALKKAKRLQVISLVYLATAVSLVAAVMGSSQAMKAAWIEDCLSFLPPLAFLLAVRKVRREPDHEHPYGYHRAVGAAHLAASVALLALGGFMVVDSMMTLVRQEHPTISTIDLFGHTVWLGWVMMGALVYTGFPPVILGRMKLKLAEQLHDKVLYADADMNKADWSTAGGAMLGILGIGLGLWWADSVVATFIAASIVKDGWTNISNALSGLLDRQARTYDDSEDHPAIDQVRRFFAGLPWVDEVAVRMRDEGHVFHTEVFVVPVGEPSLQTLETARDRARELDWKLQDLQVVPVSELPA
ncbi:cation transporter [Luteococcus peritonei]|uniref:Cation transporter n=1 Tax=Luteococcus peritonei TaxID=88874 RepID=A0ABW4RUK1_9ACTN